MSIKALERRVSAIEAMHGKPELLVLQKAAGAEDGAVLKKAADERGMTVDELAARFEIVMIQRFS